MKIRLPNLPRLSEMRKAGPTPGAGAPGADPAGPVVIGGMGDRMRLYSRRLRGSAGWVFLAVFVFFTFVWISLPTRAIAWRIGQEARKAGYLIDIEDVSLWPWGSVTLHNVVWTYAPSHPGQIPHKLPLDRVDIDVSVWRYMLLGDVDVEVDTAIDEVPLHVEYARSDAESSVKIEVTELPLMDVPKLQQAVNAPLRGLFALHVDLTMPDNEFAKAQGEISLECSSCTLGDGETLLYVPGATGILAKGITLPEIDLGTLTGKLVVADGKATAETFETKSSDLELVVTGELALKDPFSKSEFGFNIKLLVTQALQDRSEPLKLVVQTASSATKMDPPDEGWLGFKMRGTGGRPRFMGIKTKTAEERTLELRRKKAERDAARQRKTKTREPAAGERDSIERNNMPAGGTGGPAGEERGERPQELPPLGLQPGTPENEADMARENEQPPMPSTVPSQPPPSVEEARQDERAEEPRQDERMDERPQEPPPQEPPPEQPQQPEGGQDQGQGGGENQDGQQPQGQEQGGQPQGEEAPQGNE